MIGWLVAGVSVFVVCVAPVLITVAEALDEARSSQPYDDDVPARPRVEVLWRPAAPDGVVGWGSFAHVRAVARRPFDWEHDDRDMAAMGEATHG